MHIFIVFAVKMRIMVFKGKGETSLILKAQ